MLAVVLIPLSVLVIACLLERLEARVTPTAGVRLAPRRIAAPSPSAVDRAPGTARRQHLRAVPDPADESGDGGSWSRAS